MNRRQALQLEHVERAEDQMIFEKIHDFSSIKNFNHYNGIEAHEVSLLYDRPRGRTLSLFELGAIASQPRYAVKPRSTKKS